MFCLIQSDSRQFHPAYSNNILHCVLWCGLRKIMILCSKSLNASDCSLLSFTNTDLKDKNTVLPVMPLTDGVRWSVGLEVMGLMQLSSVSSLIQFLCQNNRSVFMSAVQTFTNGC